MERNKKKVRIVVDTNILISALLKDSSLTGKILRSNACNFYYPEDGLSEIDCYREYIISKRARHVQTNSFDFALEFVLESVNVVPSEMYSSKIGLAFDLMKERDVKDTPFLALALQLGCPLWSNDKHFQGLEGVLVYSTEAFVELPKGKGSWR